jgi:restriction endonuclease S subunit
MRIQRRLGDVLVEIKQGIGEQWANYPVLGATRNGLAPAKEPPGKHATKYKPVFPGTVFYNPMRILIGSIAFVDEDEQPGITSPDYVVLRGREGIVDSRWFYYWLRSPLGVQCINGLARGAVRERMLFNRLAEGTIELPSFTAQQKASSALRELKPIRTAVSLLHDTEILRVRVLEGIFKRLKSAETKILGNYANTTSGSTPSRGIKQYWQPAEIPWVKTGEVNFSAINTTEEAISRTALAECSLTLLPPQTVLIAMYGQGKARGQTAILDIEATTNQACFAILPNDTWESEFLYYWSMASYQDLRNLSENRGGNQANLNGALLNALEIPAPEKTEQRHIVRQVKAALREIEVIEQTSK